MTKDDGLMHSQEPERGAYLTSLFQLFTFTTDEILY